ncbi:MAG: hypothetical protein M8364_09490 [Methylobacter sp.]|uniref:hypothetical protein n=1 Tax=Methylobacter sp. TaxID=2051955 RepID=UPI0025857265|nr:hypothetical protein [Methylobacter sp.]MCL7421122.1 hypothetical protein [Methylobacter sp.]
MSEQKFSYSRLLLAMTVSLGSVAAASAADCLMPQPLPPEAQESVTVTDGVKTTTIITPENTIFPSQDPFAEPPGSNHLPTVYKNVCDSNGVEVPNTLPSTPEHPYNLHPDPVVSEIDKTSPTDDLAMAFKKIKDSNGSNAAAVQKAIDVLEGNPIPGRNYSGMPMLHYNGPDKVKHVQPIFENGVKVGGIVEIHQIWFDSHIESDTNMIDPSDVLDVPWTIHYKIDTLNRGHEDFAPMVMYFDDPALSPPGMPPMPNVLMDQTFFPMEDGTRTEYEIKMAPGKYYNLSYHWGWRRHPPRVQVAENARKMLAGKTLVEWETSVFGEHPTASEADKLAAIAKIGDLAPAKRMWNTLRSIKSNGSASSEDIAALDRAFYQWQDRNKLPDGITADPDSDWTLLFVNNTIYGQMKGITDDSAVIYPDWKLRGKTVKIKLLNGDHFDHAYFNVDFGGRRGWENTFQSTEAIGGAGQWFTFGRAHWWVNAGMPTSGKPSLIITPPATGSGDNTIVGEHNLVMQMNFEPSRRIRWYQFDPLHHDIAVWSIH